jgi:glycosyltransferase 2 family protein
MTRNWVAYFLKIVDRFKPVRIWLRWVGFAIGAAVILYQVVLSIITFRQKSVSVVYPGNLLLGFLIALVALGLQMFAWLLIVRGLGGGISISVMLGGYVPSFLPRYIPGTVWGYLSRSEWFNARGIGYSITMTSSVLEILSTITANIMVCVFVWGRSGTILNILGVILVIVTLPLVFIAVFRSKVPGRMTNRLGFVSKFFEQVQQLCLGNWLVSIYLFTLMWILNGVCLYEIYLGFGIPVITGISNAVIIFTGVFALSWLIGFFTMIAPAGLGIREVALMNFLTLFAGSSIANANIASLFIRITMLMSEVIWLLVALCVIRFAKR